MNANVLMAGNGGNGGNGRTAGKTLVFSNGGNGGNGGSVNGGGVYITAGTVTFTNDTIVGNVANLILSFVTGGAGGSGGAAAGNGTGTNGTAGFNGTDYGGGFFSGAAAATTVGNTIIDLNVEGSNLNAPGAVPATVPYASSNSDASGVFIARTIWATTSSVPLAVLQARAGTATGFSAGTGDQMASTRPRWTLGRSKTTADLRRPTNSLRQRRANVWQYRPGHQRQPLFRPARASVSALTPAIMWP